MWTRKELKEKAKERFSANYWKAVLVGLILAICVGTAGPTFTKNFDASDFGNSFSDYQYELEDRAEDEIDRMILNNEAAASDVVGDVLRFANDVRVLAPFFGIIAAIGTIIAVGSTCLKIFLFNPLVIGGNRFFIKNLDEEASLSELGAGFSNNYLNGVLIMFLRDLFNALWFCLFIIPGIVKAYEYRMISYLIADNPEITREEAFAKSKEMMMGNKWNAFVLDLSFIGWHILNALTFGILGVFYVNPYVYQTDAALYEKLLNNTTPVQPEAPYIEVE